MHDHRNRVGEEMFESQYSTRPVLEPAMLDAILVANLGFLGLVAKSPRDSAKPVYGLSSSMAAAVARLDPGTRRTVAGLPYTLFNLRFESPSFWRAVVRDAARPGSGSLSAEATFARTAVFLAWHLVQGGELAPAMVLGMTPEVIDAWRGLPLSALDHAATRSLPWLQARWGENSRFWPKLVVAAAPGRGGIGAPRELGLQLLAAQGLAQLTGNAAGPAAGR